MSKKDNPVAYLTTDELSELLTGMIAAYVYDGMPNHIRMTLKTSIINGMGYLFARTKDYEGDIKRAFQSFATNHEKASSYDTVLVWMILIGRVNQIGHEIQDNPNFKGLDFMKHLVK